MAILEPRAPRTCRTPRPRRGSGAGSRSHRRAPQRHIPRRRCRRLSTAARERPCPGRARGGRARRQTIPRSALKPLAKPLENLRMKADLQVLAVDAEGAEALDEMRERRESSGRTAQQLRLGAPGSRSARPPGPLAAERVELAGRRRGPGDRPRPARIRPPGLRRSRRARAA